KRPEHEGDAEHACRVDLDCSRSRRRFLHSGIGNLCGGQAVPSDVRQADVRQGGPQPSRPRAMSPCVAACGRPQLPPSLIQIRKNYAAQWNDLSLCIESEPAGWMLRIQRASDRKDLYQAERGTIAAAKAAGIEFAMFHAGGATLQAG